MQPLLQGTSIIEVEHDVHVSIHVIEVQHAVFCFCMVAATAAAAQFIIKDFP